MRMQNNKAKLARDINTLKKKLDKAETTQEVSTLSNSISKLESFRDNLNEQDDY
jgi:hypothetical protein